MGETKTKAILTSEFTRKSVSEPYISYLYVTKSARNSPCPIASHGPRRDHRWELLSDSGTHEDGANNKVCYKPNVLGGNELTMRICTAKLQ